MYNETQMPLSSEQSVGSGSDLRTCGENISRLAETLDSKDPARGTGIKTSCYNARLKLKKFGSAAFISHLDLMKTIQRSLKRSGLPVSYTQGFNPHIYISILAPLSTGFESDYELCDVDFTTETAPHDAVEKLNIALPDGIRALELYQSARPLKDIAYAKYEIFYPNGNARAMEDFFAADIIVTKESKRQSREVKIKDYIAAIEFSQGQNGAVCVCVLSLGDDQLNPVYVTAALNQGRLVDSENPPRYKRVTLFDKNFTDFR